MPLTLISLLLPNFRLISFISRLRSTAPLSSQLGIENFLTKLTGKILHAERLMLLKKGWEQKDVESKGLTRLNSSFNTKS